jgi:putative heme-binding domain-containing protein
MHKNDWYVRHARRILQERAAVKQDASVAAALAEMAKYQPSETKRLRALWASHVYADGKSPRTKPYEVALADKHPIIRAWGIQLGLENASTPPLELIQQMAKQDSSAVVRLYLASAMQRLELKDRWQIAEALLAHSEDATDHNLPFMYWYAIEPLADVDPARALALALNGKIPLLHGYMIRRIGAGGDATNLLIDALAKTKDANGQVVFLTAIREALKGRRQVPMPEAWPKLFERLRASDDSNVKQQAVCLAVTFGDPKHALNMLKTRSNSYHQAAAAAALLDAGYPKLAPELHWLLDSELRGTNARRIAIRGLAAYDDPATPGNLIGRFGTFTDDERRDALNTLATRPVFAKALLDAVAAKKVDGKDVTADIVRQMRNLKDKNVSARLTELWGAVRESSADRVKLIAETKAMLMTPAKFAPDLAQGRALFNKNCAQCHTLFGEGGKLAPDLTGSNRANLDYLLENILDPSAVIPKEYAPTVIEMLDGRTLTGVIRSDTPIALTVVTANEVLTLPRKEVDTLTPTKVSLMPEDLLKQLSEPEIRALIGYLQSPVQVPIKGSARMERRVPIP